MLDLMEKDIEFTLSEKVLIDYITNHIAQLPDMTISELAKNTYTSNATIVRLSRKLGFSGFRDLKDDLIKQNEANKFINKSVDFNQPFADDLTARDVIDSITSLYRETIDEVCTAINASDISICGELLNRAENIYIYAIGDSQATADVFINKIMKLNCHAVSALARGESVRVSSIATKKDCALFITYSGESPAFTHGIPILKENKCKILSITANPQSTVAKASDYTIIIPNEESEDKIAAFYSQLTFSYILNILYGVLYLKRHK